MKEFESFRLDTDSECLWRNGTQIALPPRQFSVLRYLVEHPGRLITHEELLDALWPETYVQQQVLRTYMLELRKVLGDEAGQPRFIQTLPRRGYRFVARVVDQVVDHGVEQAAVRETQPGRISPEYAAPPTLVGREEELAHLHAQLQLVAGGHRRVVFVTGEAGIGKTALVDAFCQQLAASDQASLARGQCVEGFSETEDCYPVVEALRQLCASTGGEASRATLAAMAPAWFAAGQDGNGPASTAPQERLPGDLCVALEQLAVKKPLILVVEDLDWADAATLSLVSALARRRAPASLMLIATCRNLQTEPACNRLKQDLLIRQLCTELALASLSGTAVSEILSRRLQQPSLPPGLSAFVHQHSEGNPLFVIAIVEHLIAQKFLVRAGGRGPWEQSGSFDDSEANVPAGLAHMLELEIQRLTPGEQRILEAASLMGIAFPVWAVAAALEQDVSTTEESCDDLARRLYFVERAGQDELPNGALSSFYVFAHALYREVLYRRQSATRRAAGHLRIARRLNELFAGREANVAREVAMHFEAANERHQAVHALRAASAHARQRQAPSEAAELLERALRLAESLDLPDGSAAVLEIREELHALHASSRDLGSTEETVHKT